MFEKFGTGKDSQGREFVVFMDKDLMEVQWEYVDRKPFYSFVRALASCKSLTPYLAEYVLRRGGDMLEFWDSVDCRREDAEYGEWFRKTLAEERAKLKAHGALAVQEY